MIDFPIDELLSRAAELLRYDATAPLIFNSGLFLFLFVGFALAPYHYAAHTLRHRLFNLLLL